MRASGPSQALPPCDLARLAMAEDARAGALKYFYFGFVPLAPVQAERLKKSYHIAVVQRGCSPNAYEACYNRYVDACTRLVLNHPVPDLWQ